MAYQSQLDRAKREPAVLLVPGLDGSGPEHWPSIWEHQHEGWIKVALSRPSEPHRNTWVNNLNHAIINAGRPVVLVAHSLGCLAVAWWARYEQRAWARPVVAALLVAPPEVDFFPLNERVACFAPTPRDPLPFPSRLVASRNDPWMAFHTAQNLAREWGSTFIDAAECGHINADSELDDWTFGRKQLHKLLQDADTRPSAALPSRSAKLLAPFIQADHDSRGAIGRGG